ncbi:MULTISPECIES: helix-turn-helix domain-containing protein [Microbacterium]|uniref:helix-turn-helix domain-containing protein n=1 Tax=Microbacterium TaxID=33882 RepID=UPI00203E05F4|nr:XRE family transcriptional regulator [Microbacterium oleivorans]MCM3695918.1 XRE family transcriptional regulator [Microbacterium oleivorans]
MTDQLALAPTTRDLESTLAVIGSRVRSLRRERQLTIVELAAMTELSVSMISTVERGQTAPSLTTLHALAEALEVPLASLFVVGMTTESPVVPLDQQTEWETAGGATRRLAVDNLELGVEMYVDTYEPGDTHNRQPSHHRGYEFGLVVDGTLTVALDDEKHQVGPGDAVHYVAQRNHLISNEGDETVRAVWFNLRRRSS